MAKAAKTVRRDDDFYEVMPYASGEPYADNRPEEIEHLEQDAKAMAIGTLIVLTVLVAVLIVIVAKGLAALG